MFLYEGDCLKNMTVIRGVRYVTVSHYSGDKEVAMQLGGICPCKSGAALHQCYQLVLCAAGIHQNKSRAPSQGKKRNVYGQPCAVRLSERPR